MRSILAVLLLSLSINSYAEQIPDGCYVAYNNPGFCYSSFSGYYEWQASGNRVYDQLKYGYAFEALLSEWNVNSALANTSYSLYSTCISDYNKLITPYNKNLSLIKKLRKACGSKCKRIK